jgi:hypothetical protein
MFCCSCGGSRSEQEEEMAAPVTVNASGFFDVVRAGTPFGEALIRMRSATRGTLHLGSVTVALTADVAAQTLTGKWSGQTLTLKIKSRNQLTGLVGADKLAFARRVLRPIPAAEMAQFDAGPSAAMKAIFDATPDYLAATGDATIYWHHFGNVFYRGRLDGSARLMCVASDPGPAECLPFARRCLVGDSGQKTQGFLSKVGLTRSYVLVNAFTVAMHPGESAKGLKVLRDNVVIKAARHALYDAVIAGGNIQAIVGFGEVAQRALALWLPTNAVASALPLFEVAHPAAVDRESSGNDAALKGWVKAVTALRGRLTPDPDGDPAQPNFGSYFTEADYVRIPRWDVMAITPTYLGDDSWGRAAAPRHNNCCKRLSPDDLQSLRLTPAPGQGQVLTYRYRNGALIGAKNAGGAKVTVDEFGLA